MRVPSVAQWDQWHLVSTGMQVGSPAQGNGLRIRRCRSCGLGHNCDLDLIPSLGTPYTLGWPKKKKKIAHIVQINQIIFLKNAQ